MNPHDINRAIYLMPKREYDAMLEQLFELMNLPVTFDCPECEIC